ncbi:hypothetical protein DRO26_04060 [Candidatus Bathyarchaeota archaeon]|nr:MAG: hypothetical protein DRO26_04060 [Candidatus Bathyarchaeota archaeon]
MYTKLYNAWQNEEEHEEIQSLPENFYQEVASYLKKLTTEIKSLDGKSLKAKLKNQELKNIQLLLQTLIQKRFQKIVETLFKRNATINQANLTREEKVLYNQLKQVKEKLDSLVTRVLEGTVPEYSLEKEPKNVILRFLQETPALVGVDLKTYGPFKAEDIVSIPLGNIESLIKRGIVKKVNI